MTQDVPHHHHAEHGHEDEGPAQGREAQACGSGIGAVAMHVVPPQATDSGLWALARVARVHGVHTDAMSLAHDITLGARAAEARDIARAARGLGLKVRHLAGRDADWLRHAPRPLILGLRHGGFGVLRRLPRGEVLVEPARVTACALDQAVLAPIWTGEVILARPHGAAAPADDRFGLSWFMGCIWRYRAPLAHVLVASLFTQLFALVTPLFFQVVIDKVLVHRSESTLLLIVGCMVIIGTFDVILQYLRSYTLSHTSSRIDVELGAKLFRKLLKLPLDYFETRPAGQTVARVREIESIRTFLTGQGLSAIIDGLFTLVFLAVLFAYSTILGSIVLASLPLYALITIVLRPALRSRIQERFECNAASQQFLVESVIGIATLKAAAVEPLVQRQWEDRLARYVKSAFRGLMLAAAGHNAIQYVTKMSTVAILYFGAQQVIAGHMSVGALVAFNMIANQLVSPILRLSNVWQDFQQVQISVDRIGDILNAPPERQRSAATSAAALQGRVEFREVCFRYSHEGPPVLKHISLAIEPGEVIGVVGPSGSGKSTLAKLLQRFYLPSAGQVLIDGKPTDELHPAWLRRQVGVVLQENFLFNRSVAENIALARPDMSRDAILRVASLAGADDFIRGLPQGYDTQVEERGANLSGGQRQRIAIARALASDPRLVIFDEATSALDYESEQVIQSNMRLIARGRTVLIIAHRLAAVRGCDRIIGVQDGEIIECGSHAELLAQGGLYARLWNLQQNGLQDRRIAS
jgi:subfamily B ATP-binding cassette protein HlyB/CyaB